MNIRTTLISIVSILAIFVISYSAISFYNSYGNAKVANQTIRINEALNYLLDSADSIFAARGETLLALSRQEAISSANRKKIDDANIQADDLLNKAIESIQALPNFDRRDSTIEEIRKNNASLQEQRKSFDSILSQAQNDHEQIVQKEETYLRAVNTLYDSMIQLNSLINMNLYEEAPIDHINQMRHSVSVIVANLSELRDHLAQHLNMNEYMDKDQIFDLGEHIPVARALWSEMDSLMEGSILKAKLSDKYTKLKKSYETNYIANSEKIFESGVKGIPYTINADQWFESATLALKDFAAFSDDLNNLSTQYANEESNSSIMAASVAGLIVSLGVFVGFFAFFVISRRVIRPISRLQANIDAISGGDTSIEVDVSRNDEIGSIAKALNNLKTVVAKSFELQQMIEEMPVSVLVADPNNDFTITYGNKSTLEMMRGFEKTTGLKAEEIIGQKIHRFHKNQEHQVALLSNPKNLPYKTRVQMGQDWVDLEASAIYDNHQNYKAVMTTWKVVTRQVQLADNFESSVKGVVELVSTSAGQLKSSAEIMSQNADKTNHSSNIVASASEEASANVQTVASAAEELSNSIQEIARQVSQSTMICNKAVGQAKSTNATIQFLADSAHKIGEVVNLITEIAGKTNLLALNATIEAARAGEAGKGFAVVASEVKDLANQTAKATDEIAGQISSIQNSTSDAVNAIEGIGKVITELNEIATSIASAVEEQGAATKEIAMNVQQTAQGTQEVSSNILEVSKAASETGSTASEVLCSAEELTNQSAQLQSQVDKFLKDIRAA